MILAQKGTYYDLGIFQKLVLEWRKVRNGGRGHRKWHSQDSELEAPGVCLLVVWNQSSWRLGSAKALIQSLKLLDFRSQRYYALCQYPQQCSSTDFKSHNLEHIYYVTTLVFHPSSGFMQISITGSTSILVKSKPPNNGISNFLKGTESLLCSKVCWTSGLLLLLPRLAENPVNRPFCSVLLLSCSLIFF